jgi:hypothetical protein
VSFERLCADIVRTVLAAKPDEDGAVAQQLLSEFTVAAAAAAVPS